MRTSAPAFSAAATRPAFSAHSRFARRRFTGTWRSEWGAYFVRDLGSSRDLGFLLSNREP